MCVLLQCRSVSHSTMADDDDDSFDFEILYAIVLGMSIFSACMYGIYLVLRTCLRLREIDHRREQVSLSRQVTPAHINLVLPPTTEYTDAPEMPTSSSGSSDATVGPPELPF